MEKTALQFHIEQNDCLGTLATVVDLVSQSLKKRSARMEIIALREVDIPPGELHPHAKSHLV
jgi:hypothetical protein